METPDAVPPTRENGGIVVARFQAAVLWSVGAMVLGGFFTFFGYRLIQGYDAVNESQDRRISASESNLAAYKLERELVLEALKERLTRLEERQAAYETRIAELRQGQTEILSELRKLEHR